MITDLSALAAEPLSLLPYPHCVVRDFLPPLSCAQLREDFPELSGSGLYLASDTDCGPSMRALLRELEGPQLRDAVSHKLGIDLSGRPPLITLRGRCAARDGRIHADSTFKLATLLLYLNEPWGVDGGRLRILNGPDDIEDYAAEVPPQAGTLVLFKVQDNSWHGHRPFSGPRRYVMVNYCANQAVRDSEAARHRFSARVKAVRRLFGVEA